VSACALCGSPARPPFRAPAPEQAPDLDRRPGEPTRSTIAQWLSVCPGCGAAAPDLASLPAAARPVVDDPDYAALHAQEPAAARPFLCWSMICLRTGNVAAAEAMLQAAWVADDAGDEAAARTWRLDAVALWGEPADAADAQRLLDVLRRAGAFDRAATLAEDLLSRAPDRDAAAILRFQLARIAAGDAGRHTIASVLPPPARSPHVAHGRKAATPATGGFWRRLFGR
jgi:hypothetical protein